MPHRAEEEDDQRRPTIGGWDEAQFTLKQRGSVPGKDPRVSCDVQPVKYVETNQICGYVEVLLHNAPWTDIIRRECKKMVDLKKLSLVLWMG